MVLMRSSKPTGKGRKKAWRRLRRDIYLLILGALVGYWFIHSGIIHTILGSFDGAPIIASFVAGFFFTSIFTTVPAIAALYEICQDTPLLLVATVGAMGAVIGDLIIFRFVKDDIAEDVQFLFNKRKFTRFFHLFNTKLFEWSLPLVGALIIASPLPDELGLTLLGFSKLKTRQFILVSFLFNALGIMIIGAFAGAL